jgi:hypothetical protein
VTDTAFHPKTLTTASVRAILAGRKTQLRQVLDPQPPDGAVVAGVDLEGRLTWTEAGHTVRGEPCPLGGPGDRLWVREPWALPPTTDGALDPEQARRHLRYLADEELRAGDPGDQSVAATGFHPAREMPQWASRLTLEITAVRAEQLQVISPEDLTAEGAMWREGAPAQGMEREGFEHWWNAVNAAGDATWEHNPWVWVVEFRRIDPQ